VFASPVHKLASGIKSQPSQTKDFKTGTHVVSLLRT